jgi:hypothetical protein
MTTITEINKRLTGYMGNCWHPNSTVNGGCKKCPDCPEVIALSPELYRTKYTEKSDAAFKVVDKLGELGFEFGLNKCAQPNCKGWHAVFEKDNQVRSQGTGPNPALATAIAAYNLIKD